jgi:N utilization substance protein B
MRKTHDPKLRHQARVLALQALYQWQMHDDLAPTELKNNLPAQEESPEVDTDYFEQLITETPGYSAGLDKQLEPFMQRPISDVGHIELAIARLGAYELVHTTTPRTVILNEAIRLAKEFGSDDSHKFINKVLDQFADSIGRAKTR